MARDPDEDGRNDAGGTLNVIEVEITPLDSLYFASREAGELVVTEPYVMHTALYYALGLFPTQFRVGVFSPQYTDHRDGSTLGTAVYIHPAVPTRTPDFQTRRFAAKGDAFREASERHSRNFKETGHQKMIAPEQPFVTYMTTTEAERHQQLLETLPSYIRLGKTMATARVETATHAVPIEMGEFSLGQPIAAPDYESETYELLGGLRWQRMRPADLILEADVEGPYARLKPTFDLSESVCLPTATEFFAQR